MEIMMDISLKMFFVKRLHRNVEIVIAQNVERVGQLRSEI